MSKGDKPDDEHPEVLISQSLHKIKLNTSKMVDALEKIAGSLEIIARDGTGLNGLTKYNHSIKGSIPVYIKPTTT